MGKLESRDKSQETRGETEPLRGDKIVRQLPDEISIPNSQFIIHNSATGDRP
ncbi:hypothetical protein JNM87_02055 [Candidatus Saccharibacteria bacterium]|nr:hypothetical protein [Candidatus Saccharibacteria bacterium]